MTLPKDSKFPVENRLVSMDFTKAHMDLLGADANRKVFEGFLGCSIEEIVITDSTRAHPIEKGGHGFCESFVGSPWGGVGPSSMRLTGDQGEEGGRCGSVKPFIWTIETKVLKSSGEFLMQMFSSARLPKTIFAVQESLGLRRFVQQ